MSKTRLRATRPEATDETETCRILHALRETPDLFTAIAAGPPDELALQAGLREVFPDDLVRAALHIASLRRRAVGKFARAETMWFDRVGLEQSTSEPLARHKAARFSGEVDDLCCGIGGDAVALARHCHVNAVDLRPSLTLMAAWNAEVYGVADRVTTTVGDVMDRLAGDRLVHLDPDRRSGTRQSIRIEDYHPGLESLHRLMEVRPGGAVKLSPASNFGGKFADCEIELVSLQGECKEAVVWFGSLAGADDWRATVLPSGTTISGDPLSAATHVGPVAAYVYDPDPAVVRSGLLDVVADRLGLLRLDGEEEYLTSDALVTSDFVTPFEVVDELPNSDKQVRRYFREHAFGQVEIKCRHIPVDAGTYRRKLSLSGSEPITLIIARADGRSRAFICRRVQPH